MSHDHVRTLYMCCCIRNHKNGGYEFVGLLSISFFAKSSRFLRECQCVVGTDWIQCGLVISPRKSQNACVSVSVNGRQRRFVEEVF